MTRQKAETLPIYFLYGPEDYLIEEETRKLLDQTLSPHERGFNLHLFNGEEHSGQEIVQTAQTLPMFSRCRFIIIRRADLFDEENIKTLVSYIRNPSPSTYLVMIGQTPGSWKPYLKEIARSGTVMEYPRLKGRGLISWVRERMEEKGKTISEEAVRYLIEKIGDHLQELDNGLEKVFLSVGDRRNIELFDVEAITSEVKVSTIYDLTDAIGQRNLKKALTILERALETKAIPFRREEPISKRRDDPAPLLVDMMAKHYWNLLRVKELAETRKNIQEIVNASGMMEGIVRKLLEQEKNYTAASLRESILRCHRTDLAIKTGKGPKPLLLEKLVIDLCLSQTKRILHP